MVIEFEFHFDIKTCSWYFDKIFDSFLHSGKGSCYDILALTQCSAELAPVSEEKFVIHIVDEW